MSPLLTLLVPNYNRPQPLARLLRSIFSAIDRHDLGEAVRVLVVDDHSDQDISAALDPWLKRDNFASRLQNGKQGNAERAFLSALSHVSTEFTWLLGNDDFIAADSIKHVLRLLQRGEYGFVLLNPRILKTTTNTEFAPIASSTPALRYETTADLFQDFGFATSTTTFPCLIFRTKPVADFHARNNLCAAATVYSHSFTLYAALFKEPALFLTAPIVGFTLNEVADEQVKLQRQAPSGLAFHHQTLGVARLVHRTAALTGASVAELGDALEDEVDKGAMVVHPTVLSAFCASYFLRQLSAELRPAAEAPRGVFMTDDDIAEILRFLGSAADPAPLEAAYAGLDARSASSVDEQWRAERLNAIASDLAVRGRRRYRDVAQRAPAFAPRKLFDMNSEAYPTRATPADDYGRPFRRAWSPI